MSFLKRASSNHNHRKQLVFHDDKAPLAPAQDTQDSNVLETNLEKTEVLIDNQQHLFFENLALINSS